ncbi:uncharacterized protein LOC111078932 isoform X2 [Drosophila obscura]|uniref:uncharacterized protein LOC111078932 isoform X2 n=1 Tax=Drosophila obscura TaxID=7282 RepID=UPI001BB11F77|nr:uncharacterized protein LOC111078932 isoform X2 [Drosophila obscura]XP_041450730.1 uncharacterized protein LOC111078932 isoform X2 [Drosophila obscura]
MADVPGAPIISIYDLLLERKILLAGKGAFRKQRNQQEPNEPMAETATKAKTISSSISKHLSCSSDGEVTPSGPANVSASHLIKKRTGVIMQQPTKKEVPDKLPKNAAPRILSAKTKTRASSVGNSLSDASTSKPLTSTRRKTKKKKVQASGGSTSKSYLIDHSADQRMPMSPRKAGGEILARAKTPTPTATTPKLNTPKTSQTKLRLKGRKSKTSLGSSKTPTTPSSVNRWRI